MRRSLTDAQREIVHQMQTLAKQLVEDPLPLIDAADMALLEEELEELLSAVDACANGEHVLCRSVPRNRSWSIGINSSHTE